jgi:hypothetical protein
LSPTMSSELATAQAERVKDLTVLMPTRRAWGE